MTSRYRGVILTLASQGMTAFGSAATMILLARSLSTEGRGLVSAVLAPALLITALCPAAFADSVTYFVARHPTQSRRIVKRALLLAGALTLAGILVTWLSVPFLGRGYPEAQGLMAAVAWTALLGCVLVLLRARANAQRKWNLIVLDSFVANCLRPLSLVVLLAAGGLTVTNAAWALAIAASAGVVVYLPWRSPARRSHADGTQSVGSQVDVDVSYRQISKYSLGSWVGVVSASALGFFDQLLMTPLAGAEQLAFYAVAMGITNLVGTVAVSIRAVVFSTESAEADWPRIAQSARLSLWVTTVFAAVVALACPVMLPALFGAPYAASVVPLLILLVSTTALAPGTVATAGLAAAGKPHLRAVAVGLGAVCNLLLVLALVPGMGAIGGAIAMLATIPISVLAISLTRRFHELSFWAFVAPDPEDFRILARASRIPWPARRGS